MGNVLNCQSCQSSYLGKYLDLGPQPLAEGGSEARYPLCLVKCQQCGLVQLDYIVDQATVFRPEHPYSTGNTKALRDHFAWLAQDLHQYPFGQRTIVDIGANDGTFLNFVPAGYKRIGVEPTNQIDKAGNEVIKYKDFFTRCLAHQIWTEQGSADYIIATNVLAHVPDVHDFLEGVRYLLGDNGEFITENHDLASITEDRQFDTIYHEHLRYYSPGSLAYLLERHGFRVVSSQSIDTHGGSFRMRCKRGHGGFPANVYSAAEDLSRTLRGLWQAGRDIWGIGATTRATPLIHFADIAQYLKYVCEVPGSDKIGTKIPGTNIKVCDEKWLIEKQPEYALLLSYHIAESIIPKLKEKGYRGKFIIPIPEVKIVD